MIKVLLAIILGIVSGGWISQNKNKKEKKNKD